MRGLEEFYAPEVGGDQGARGSAAARPDFRSIRRHKNRYLSEAHLQEPRNRGINVDSPVSQRLYVRKHPRIKTNLWEMRGRHGADVA